MRIQIINQIFHRRPRLIIVQSLYMGRDLETSACHEMTPQGAGGWGTQCQTLRGGLLTGSRHAAAALFGDNYIGII